MNRFYGLGRCARVFQNEAMQRDNDKQPDEVPPQSGSFGIGVEGHRGKNSLDERVSEEQSEEKIEEKNEEKNEEPQSMTAYDIKETHDLLPDLSADELQRLHVAAPGSPLVENAKYIDLRHRERGEIQARAGMLGNDVHWYVLKNDVDYQLWNKLLGTPDVRRTGTSG